MCDSRHIHSGFPEEVVCGSGAFCACLHALQSRDYHTQLLVLRLSVQFLDGKPHSGQFFCCGIRTACCVSYYGGQLFHACLEIVHVSAAALEYIAPLLIAFGAYADFLRCFVDLVARRADIVRHIPQLFSCGNTGCSDCCRSSPESRTDFLCGISEAAQLSVSVLTGIGGFPDGIGEVLGFISGFVKALVSLFKGGVVGTKLTLHAVESRLRVVQLYLPALSAAVVLAERLGSIGECGAERFDFLFLTVDFLVQHLVSCRESLGGFVVLVELRIHKFHFRA